MIYRPIMWTVAVLICAFFATGAMAQQTPKTAVIDVQALMRDSAAAKSIRVQVDQKRSGYREEISAKENELRAADQNLAQQRTVLSPEAFAERQRQFQKQVADVQRLVQTRNRQLDQGLAQAMQEVEKTIAKIGSEIAREKGLDMILAKNMVIYAAASFDITAEVLRRLDRQLPTVPLREPKE